MTDSATAIQVEVAGATYKIDIDPDALSLQESVRLEECVGPENFDRLMGGELPSRPSFIRALLFSKLKTQIPDLEIDGFDLDIGDLERAVVPERPSPGEDSESE